MGLMQGVTEFLPISSSGHLVILQELLRWKGPRLEFDVAVHIGTLFAILVVLHKKIWSLIRDPLAYPNRLILLGTLPTAVAGLIVHFFARRAFESGILASTMLTLTGFYLWSTRKIPQGEKDALRTSPLDALLVGIAQGLSVLPGLSRSGLTIATGLHRGLERQWAGEFAFLLAIPALVGAAILEAPRMAKAPVLPLAMGTVSAFLSGSLALLFLLKVVRGGKLHRFAPYCWAVGIGYTVLVLL